MRKQFLLLSLAAVFLFLNSQMAMAEVIFSENYDSQPDWACTDAPPVGWSGPNAACFTDTYNGVYHAGGEISSPGRGGTGKSLKQWRHNGWLLEYNGNSNWLFSEAEFNNHHKQISSRYYIRFDPGFDVTGPEWPVGLKLNRYFIDTVYADPGFTQGHAHAFMINIGAMSFSDGQFIMGNAGGGPGMYYSQLTVSQVGLNDGNWHCLEVHLKMNSATGVADGEAHWWIDGNELYFGGGGYPPFTQGVVGVDWGYYTNEYITKANDPGIGNSAVGNSWDFPTNEWYKVEFDDYVISTTPIGCTGTPPSPYCGDLSCNGAETCSSCPQDCGSCLPTQEKFIFHDSLPAGAGILQGDPMEVSNESPYQGTNSLKITSQGAWSNCRIINLNLSVQNMDWSNAYLEFALNSSVPSSYVAVNLWGDGTHSPEQAFALSGSGQYETFRISMTDFSPTQPGFGNAITQFMIGTNWGSGNPVYLDEIRIASPGQCAHKSDSDCNSCVDMSELTAFIDRWKINNQDVTLKEIIEAIGLWKRGCP